MESREEPKGAGAPESEITPAGSPEQRAEPPAPGPAPSSEATSGHPPAGEAGVSVATASEPPAPAAGKAAPPAPPSTDTAEEDHPDEENGMLRMSFMEHLEELRMRIILSLAGLGVAFVLCIVFANQLWLIISEPAMRALRNVGADPNLAQITPMDAFITIWVKVPMLTALFVASPWILFQVWGFIAPGLYRRERRWAGPFVICTAGLFILGGLFAYFVAFRLGLEFLLSIGRNINVKPVVSLTEYFDLFVNVTLGIGLVFELPVLLFFLTLLRIVNPKFLLRNTRYAVLVIVIIAALVTPTPDVFNLMIFTVPMIALYFVGIFASYLLVLRRERRRFPWGKVIAVLAGLLLLAAGGVWIAIASFGFHLAPYWPFLIRGK
jgi:sec-independent protein translocase protein TatC